MSMPATVLDMIAKIDGALPAIDDGTLRLSYADVQRSIAAERRWLQSMRVRRCALHAGNSARWILSDLALLAREAVNIPLPPSFTREQRAHVVDDAGIEWVLTDVAEQFTRDHPAFSYVATSHRTGLALLRRDGGSLQHAPSTADISKVTYTSGSTGAPKGVCLRQAVIQSVIDSLVAATAGLGIQTHLCLLPLATLLENIAGVYVPLTLGARLVVPPAHTSGVSYAGLKLPLLLRAIDEASPESMILVPELLRAIVYAVGGGWRAPASLKFIAVGGGVVSSQLLEQARRAGLPVFQGYGLSECASVVCLNTPQHYKAESVGRPLPHVRARIDTNGEICVSGATMAGYLGGPQHQDSEVRTGDLGEIDAEGFVYVRGRVKNMFITSMGRNITPEWVERELTVEPAIAQAMVSGEAKPYPVALVVASSGANESSVDNAIDRANSRLPDYARVRRWGSFPEAPTLANGLLTANGRLRRAEIAAKYHQLIDSLYDHATRNLWFHELLASRTVDGREYLTSAPIIRRALAGQIRRDEYIAFLTQAFHHVRHTVRLMMAVGARLPARLGWLRKEIIHYTEEEEGHDRWILSDIAAAGGDALAAERSLPSIATDAMVAYAYDTAMRRNPVGFFGMVFVLEGASIALACDAADRIQASLQLPDKAMTYLRSHGQLDQQHVQDLYGILNRFEEDQDRAAVERCAQVMFRLYGNVFRGLDERSVLSTAWRAA